MATVAVVGATGFVGTRLLPALVAAGHDVRALVRNPAKVPVGDRLSAHRIDLDSGAGIADALDGVDAAVWLVHRMREGDDFAERDRAAAEHFANACAHHGVGRIVYLGGLVDDNAELSPHLASRAEVAEVLASTDVPLTTLRAGIILGAGSAGFEIMRQLVEHLPVMVTPKWVVNRTQPVAVDDLIAVLVAATTAPAALGRSFDVGGPDIRSFAEMMSRFAQLREIAHVALPVGVLTPELSARWIGLVTDVDPVMARHLIQSLVNETLCRDDSVHELVPDRTFLGFEDACRSAIDDAHGRGMRTRPGQDFEFLVSAVGGAALNYASLDLTATGKPGGAEAGVAALAVLGTAALAADRRGLIDLDLDTASTGRAVATGLAAGGGLAAASLVVTAAARKIPAFGRAARAVLARDRSPRPLPWPALAVAGAAEELYWRGLVPGIGSGEGRHDGLALIAWLAPIVAARDPMLLLAGLVAGPVWAALARREGPAAAATAHAVWLPAMRAGVSRLLADEAVVLPSVQLNGAKSSIGENVSALT